MKSFKHFFYVLLLVACQRDNRTQNIVQVNPSDQDIVIGMVDAFSGSRAEFGNSARNGVILATEQFNETQSILGKKIKIEVFDDEGNPDKSKIGFEKLYKEKKITALIGASASSRSLAIAPLAQERRVPMISPASTHPDVTNGKDFIFRACFIDTFQGTMMAQFLRKQLALKSIAILVDEDLAYSMNLARVLKETFLKLGGKVVIEQSYRGNSDIHFDEQLRAIQLKKPEAIYIPGFYSNISQIAAQARNLGIRTLLVGGDGWDSDKLFEQAGGFLDGAVYSTHFYPDEKNVNFIQFREKYFAKYKREPNSFASLAYDASMMLFEAMKRSEKLNPDSIRSELANTKNFDGVTGSITLDSSRNAIKPVSILKIVNGKPTFVSSYFPR